MICIEPYDHIDGTRFGESSSAVLARLGEPARRRTNRDGEDELWYSDAIWRFHNDRLVECTLTMREPIRVADHEVSSFLSWLPSADADAVSAHGFLVSNAFGIAVDLDNEHSEFVSIFERGRWDNILHRTHDA